MKMHKDQLSLFGGALPAANASRETRMGSVESALWPRVVSGTAFVPSPAGWTTGEPSATLPLLVGVDEAGRGPLAGPVSIAAAIWKPEDLYREPRPAWLTQLDDSKRLSEKRRTALFPEVAASAAGWAIVHVQAPLIDTHNILQATFLGMCLATELALGLSEKDSPWPDRPAVSLCTLKEGSDAVPCWYAEGWKGEGPGVHALCKPLNAQEFLSSPLDSSHDPRLVLVDGNKGFSVRGATTALLPQRPVIKGDGLSWHIAGASILAKVSRDVAMEHLDGLFPVYGFARHKGYPTKQHRAALQEHGRCPVHRRSFRF